MEAAGSGSTGDTVDMTLAVRSRLSAVELRAATLDGELHRLGDAFLPLDHPVDSRYRLTALSSAILSSAINDARIIVSHRCAAWIWGWTAVPCPNLCCCVSSQHRVPSTQRRELAIREVSIDPDEVTTLDGVSITTPLRTLIDLARHDERDDLPYVLATAIRDTAQHGAPTTSTIAAALARRPSAAYLRRARERLQRARREAAP
jgi:hypothetical protein